jgi:outer membrane protein assembly factor BamA
MAPALVLAFALAGALPQAPARAPAPPASPALPAAPATLTQISVQGNLATSDEEVVRLAGVAAGMPVDDRTADEVAARLRATGRFERVEVLKRFASIADPTEIALVIIVDEGASSRTAARTCCSCRSSTPRTATGSRTAFASRSRTPRARAAVCRCH